MMKQVSLKDLKEHLSSYAEAAAKGEIIEVTKYNRPFIYLTAAQGGFLHLGSRVGQPLEGGGKPHASQGAFLEVLLADRTGHSK